MIMRLYRLIKLIQDRAPEILFVVFMGLIGYAIYLMEYGLAQ